MIVFPHCKINLGLSVTGKRSDGYHNIQSIFIPVPLRDALEAIISPDCEFELTMTGLEIAGEPQKNICRRAYDLLKKRHAIGGVKVHLHKVIPMGAGLGGGSSDGTFMLILLDKLFELNLSSTLLKNYAAELGSDCTFFTENKNMLVQGRGDVMEEIDLNLSGTHIAIVHPGIHISTQEAYANLLPAISNFDLRSLPRIPTDEWKYNLANDFEKGAVKKFPVIAKIKSTFYENGAYYAQMSGSGSAVYGLFHSPVPEMKRKFDGMFFFSAVL